MNNEVKIEIKAPAVALPLIGEKKEEKKKRGRKPVFKPTQFDLDLMHLLREGNGAIDELVGHLGVSKTELLQRLQLLKVENLATEENAVYALSVNGYNFYTAKGAKKVSLKKTFSGEVKLHKHHKVEHRDVVPFDSEKQKLCFNR